MKLEAWGHFFSKCICLLDPWGSLKSVLGFKKIQVKKLKQQSNIGHITLIGTLVLMFSKSHSFRSAFVNTQLTFYKWFGKVQKKIFLESFLIIIEGSKLPKSFFLFDSPWFIFYHNNPVPGVFGALAASINVYGREAYLLQYLSLW